MRKRWSRCAIALILVFVLCIGGQANAAQTELQTDSILDILEGNLSGESTEEENGENKNPAEENTEIQKPEEASTETGTTETDTIETDKTDETKYPVVKEKPDILLDGAVTSYQYVDSIYPRSGVSTIGEISERTRQLKENSSSYLLSDGAGGWKIEGQSWTEKNSSGYSVEYDNTTGFSFTIPDGDYQVTVKFMNSTKKSYKIVSWDERGMQTNADTVPANGTKEQTFEVSVIDGNLKLFFIPQTNAESEETGGFQIQVQSISLKTMPKRTKSTIPTLYIVGDSTAHSRTKEVYPREGWGQEFYRYLSNGKLVNQKEKTAGNGMTSYTEYKLNSLVIQNWAYSGDSTKSFWRKGKFDNLLNNVRPGDCVLIQLGHNDAIEKKAGYYTTTSEFKKNLVTFTKACQARGATCIYLSQTPRYSFKNGKIKTSVPEYKSAMKSAAKQTNSVFVDAGSVMEEFMNTLGKENAADYYMILKKGQYANYPNGYTDYSHFNSTGAKKIAQIIAVALKENKQVPSKLRKLITADSDYYQGITLDISKVNVKKTTVTKGKKGKKGTAFKLSWTKQKNAKYYVVYRYVTSSKSYKKIAVTKTNSYILEKNWTKKQLAKIKVKAVLARS